MWLHDKFVCLGHVVIRPYAPELSLETADLGANGIITEPELMAATGYSARGRLISHLERYRIPFFAGNGGQIWTTLAAINEALKPEAEHPQKVEF